MCDIRIAASDAGFGVPVNRIGLTADYEELEGLCELVGLRPMLEILLEGRIFGADEAVAKNIASRSVAPGSLDDEVAACVDRIVRAAPLVNRWHKKFIRRMAEETSLTLDERDEGFACFDTEDYPAGIRAFAAKARPKFIGR